MCPLNDNDDPEHDAGGEDAAGGTDASEEKNRVVGPLTEDELRDGGMDRIVAYVRSERTKEAIRQDRKRKKKEKYGKRQMNIFVPDNDRSRTTMRAAASAIDDETTHQAFEVILADEAIRPLVVDVAAQPALRDIVELSKSAKPEEILDAAKLAVGHPDAITLMKRMSATSRIRELVEATLAQPEFVVLGREVATGRSICMRLARLLLRLRHRHDADQHRHGEPAT